MGEYFKGAAMDGKIWAESKLDKGSKFVVEIPYI